jgi:hypothetical protein
MRAPLILLLALAACDHGPPQGRYSQYFADFDPLMDAYAIDETDLGFDLLVSELAAVTEGPDASHLIDRVSLYIRSEPAPEIDGVLVDSYLMLYGWGITLRWVPRFCLADTGLLHEVTHAVLCQLGDCDEHHVFTSWWDAVNRANDTWRPEVCR